MNRLKVLLTAMAAVALFSSSAFAGTDSSNMSVSATVLNNCTITAGSLGFGNYDTLAGSDVDASATIDVACTKGATASITLGQGANPDAASTDAAPLRRMTDGTDFLAYSLYSDSSRSVVWGNTAGTGQDYTALDNNASSLTVYGRMAAGQDVQAGSYSDTVVATISF